MKKVLFNNFDRVGDWKKFSEYMEAYISGPASKYGGEAKILDLCHFTGLVVMVWNILKYAWRLWTRSGKEHDFEKIAHYSQMAWTLKEQLELKPPFLPEEEQGQFYIFREKADE